MLRSADCADPPVIDLPQIEDDDRERLEHGLGRALEVLSSPALADAGVSVRMPTPQEGLLSECYSVPHYTGTCAMGSVVDRQGRVLGIDGVTVADASIIPLALSAFTQMPTIALAERLAQTVGDA